MKKIVRLTSFMLMLSVLLSACSTGGVNIKKDLPLKKVTEHFLIRYTEEDENAADDMANVLENAYEDLTEKYQSVPKDEIEVAIYPTYEAIQEVYQKLPKGANLENVPTVMAATLNSACFMITSPNDWKHTGESYEESLQVAVHELTHLITQQYDLPTYLKEGLAVYEQGGLQHQSYIIGFALNNRKGLSFPSSLDELANMDLTEQHGAVYIYGAALVGFVAEKYGYDKLVDLLKTKGDVTALSADKESFYNEWLKYVEEHY